MSDFESDIDDQLLELAGATEKKRKSRGAHSSSKSKKRKADPMATDSDDGPESEETDADPYPLEGKYVDEADRQKLLTMSEIQREEILAQRVEEMQKLKDKRQLALMVKNQGRGVPDGESVAQAAKRQHTVRGATKEKTRKLDELKAKRRAKDEKKRNNSPRRDRSSSPMDMEISDDESEDGLITKEEQLEEKERKLLGGGKKPEVDDEPITMQDLEKLRLTRDELAKHHLAPWFREYATHTWVRYLLGQENGQPVYRICEISDVCPPESGKTYKINDKVTDQALQLKHGQAQRVWNMDKVSNSPFTDREWDRLTKVCKVEEVKLPTKKMVEDKLAHMQKLTSQPMTESDINTMLARKTQLQSSTKPSTLSALERSRLNQARTLAMRRHDFAEMREIDAKLAEYAPSAPASPSPSNDLLAKVNERNRKANMEAVRVAEMAEAERKRRERKAAAAAAKGSNGGTPRAGTPAATGASTPGLNALPPSLLSGKTQTGKSLEASIIDAIEIDLGDF